MFFPSNLKKFTFSMAFFLLHALFLLLLLLPQSTSPAPINPHGNHPSHQLPIYHPTGSLPHFSRAFALVKKSPPLTVHITKDPNSTSESALNNVASKVITITKLQPSPDTPLAPSFINVGSENRPIVLSYRGIPADFLKLLSNLLNKFDGREGGVYEIVRRVGREVREWDGDRPPMLEVYVAGEGQCWKVDLEGGYERVSGEKTAESESEKEVWKEGETKGKVLKVEIRDGCWKVIS